MRQGILTVDQPAGPPSALRLPGATVLQIVPAMVDEPRARTAVNVASALLCSGARALVAGESGNLIGQLQALGGEWVEIPGSTHNPLKLRRNARALRDLIATERIDIVHAYSGPTAWSAHAAIRDSGAGLVTTYAGLPAGRIDRASIYQGALAHGHRIITESDYAADLVMKRHGIAPERIITIPHSVDTSRFDASAVSADRIAVLRHGWGIRPGWRVVLVPGRLNPAKGQVNVIDAIRILVNGGMRGIAFVLADDTGGEREYVRTVATRIEAQGVAGLVRRVGHCPDMPAAYAIADLIIVSTVEPAPSNQTAAEAQAMGRPVIASSVGALPEIVLAPPRVPEDARTGWLVDSSDPIELARAIAAALALDSPIRDAVGGRAHRLAEVRFSPPRVAASALDVYAAVLEDGIER